MGITDTIDNKMKRSKSVRKEKKTIGERADDITDLTEAAAEEIYKIGQYFWKKYIEGDYVPDDGIKTTFENLDKINDQVRNLYQEIDDLKIAGTKEREDIDEETRRRIRDKEAQKAERAEAKALAKQAKEEGKQ